MTKIDEKMTESNPSVQIKGIRDGLLISLGDTEWPALQADLLAQIEARQGFFKGARVALDVGNHILHVAELVPLRDMLSERGVTLWAVISNSPTTERTAQFLGLATRISKPRPQETRISKEFLNSDAALWVNRTLRSGTRIEYPGHVVVVGDVNPGAEVIAGGSVMVWGRCRGVVHAGAEGDDQAVVCALDLSPTQLRIAGVITIPPDRKENPQPEVARLKEGNLVAESWLNSYPMRDQVNE